MNNGSSYKTIQTSKGRKPQLEFVDIVGMVLWNLKSKNPIYKLCLVFGVVPSTARVWLDYGLEVMLCSCNGDTYIKNAYCEGFT